MRKNTILFGIAAVSVFLTACNASTETAVPTNIPTAISTPSPTRDCKSGVCGQE